MVLVLSQFPRQGCGFIGDLTRVFYGKVVKEIRVTAGMSTPLPTDVILEKSDEDELDGAWPFHELEGSLIIMAC